MTTPAEDSTVEDAFEALLAGRPVADEAAGLVAFTAAVRATATSPGRPSAALAELLATGRPTDQSSPSTVTAEPAPRPRGVRRRRRSTVLLPVFLTKFLATGALAKAATGAGVAVVAFTGAGAVGVLPDPVQDTFSSIVGAETVSDETQTDVDEDLTTDGEVADEETVEEPTEDDGTEDDGTEEETAEPEAFDPVAWAADGPQGDQTFGEWVREAARHGGVDGQTVRDWAHRKGMQEDDLEAEGVDLDALTEGEPAEPATGDQALTTETTETAPSQERPGNRGNGAGNAGDTAGGNGGSSANGNGGGRGNGRN
jgi:hypothetical protein